MSEKCCVQQSIVQWKIAELREITGNREKGDIQKSLISRCFGKKKVSGRRGSNPQPSAWKADALAKLSYSRKKRISLLLYSSICQAPLAVFKFMNPRFRGE